MKKLPVRFPSQTQDLIQVVTETIGGTKSEIARAAMQIGLNALMDVNRDKGHSAAIGLVAETNIKAVF